LYHSGGVWLERLRVKALDFVAKIGSSHTCI